MDDTEILSLTRQSIVTSSARVAELVSTIGDPTVAVVNSRWPLRDAAAHLVVCGGLLTDIVQGLPSPIESFDPAYHGPEFARRNADIAETDPVKLARLIVDAAERFVDAASARPADAPVVFHAHFPYTVAGVAGVLLGEEVLHGYDIATTLGRPWTIDPVDAALILTAYAPVFGLCLHPERTRGFSARFGLELRGVGQMTVQFTDGRYGLEEAGAGPVDATISADPVAFLMVGAGRLSRYEAVALGLMTFGGDRLDLAVGFPDLFVYP